MFVFIGVGYRIAKEMLGNVLSWSIAIKEQDLELRQSLSFSRNNKQEQQQLQHFKTKI